jgi:hypothetical protein
MIKVDKKLKIYSLIYYIQLGSVSNPDPEPAFHSDADPDPTFQFDANPDPDPVSRNDADPCGSGSAGL